AMLTMKRSSWAMKAPSTTTENTAHGPAVGVFALALAAIVLMAQATVCASTLWASAATASSCSWRAARPSRNRSSATVPGRAPDGGGEPVGVGEHLRRQFADRAPRDTDGLGVVGDRLGAAQVDEEAGLGQARLDDHHLDAERRDLGGERVAEALDRELGRR